MIVLSVFDGMSCAQIALLEEGIVPDVYYASEIDKYAIAQTRLNFPNTIHLGDIERWEEWDIPWEKIDLFVGGSPCQGFSFCGKKLAFDDPRSRLFFIYAAILKHLKSKNPDVKFLLENVNMKLEFLEVISNYLNIRPQNINSHRVSAQNRNRWYWSNIRTRRDGLFGELVTDIPLPPDEGILLKDILDEVVPEKYYLSDKMVQYVIDTYRLKKRFTAVDPEKALPLMEGSYASWNGTYVTEVGDKKVIQLNPSCESNRRQPYQQNRVYDIEGISPAVLGDLGRGHAILVEDKTSAYLVQRGRGKNKGGIHQDKVPTLSAHAWQQNNLIVQPDDSEKNYRVRRLTPQECCRLQTVPEWVKWNCSDAQIYKMLGLGWTIKVITRFFKYL